MAVSMEQYLELVNKVEKVEKLEQKQKEIEDDELKWALNQFRYKQKTSDEMKAFTIIEKRLGKRKQQQNMSFYRFMEILDEFIVENQSLDFRKLEVRCNKIMNTEQVFIKKGNKVVRVITLRNGDVE